MIAPGLMMRFVAAVPDARFVQIGANDGVHFDPLRPHILRHGWSGVLVEPVPYLFERLRQTYANVPGVRLEQVAIAAETGTRTMHFVRPGARTDPGGAGLAQWAEQLASFDREHVIGNMGEVSDPDALIASTEVPCITFDELCKRCGIETLDLLMVDTEGADAEIVGSVDLERHRPRMLVYEHAHLSPDERAGCAARLRGHGYELVADGLDTWALDVAVDDELSRGWRETLAGRGSR